MQTLDGKQVLAFSRDRHSLSSGDFGRQENGGRVLIASLTQFRKEFQCGSERAVHVGRVEHAATWTTACAASTRSVAARVHVLAHQPEGRDERRAPGTTGFEGTLSVVHLLVGQGRDLRRREVRTPSSARSTSHRVPPRTET